MTMIRNDEELAVQQELLGIVEGIVESWRKKLLPHHPENFAIYADGAIEQAAALKAEIDEYLRRRKTTGLATSTPQSASFDQPTNVS